MKKTLFTVVVAGALIAASAAVAAPQASPAMAPAAAATGAHGIGVVKAVDADKGTITLQHEAIAAIYWPAMTMPFKVASPALLKSIEVGDAVQFTLRSNGADSTLASLSKKP